MSMPVVGMCAAIEQASYGAWSEPAVLLPLSYGRAVEAAGGVALLLPPSDAGAQAPDELLGRVDALLLAGGSDVDPASYGARPHPETASCRPERDRFELALVHRALERDMPVLGVCRGMQILNVATGGTLLQHLPDVVGSDRHRHTPGAFGDHEVRLEPGSLAARASGAERLLVKSHHHQGVDELGEGVTPSGWSMEDDLIEAIELRERRYALGVLWHPEEDVRSRVVGSLVEELRAGVALR